MKKNFIKNFLCIELVIGLGLDVHDAGQYIDDLQGMDSKPVKFQDSNVLTIEPGCYIKPNSNVPEEFWGIGIRIEDDVLVTPSGNKSAECECSKRD